MAVPVIIEPVIQRDAGDCVIASLAMVLGLPYVQVYTKAHEFYPDAHTTGLTTREMMRVVRALGKHLTSVAIKDVNLEAETGILDVRKGSGKYHAVVLFEGVIFNPADGLLYTLEAFLASSKTKPTRFFRP